MFLQSRIVEPLFMVHFISHLFNFLKKSSHYTSFSFWSLFLILSFFLLLLLLIGIDSNGSSSSASVHPSPRTEDEILQSPNLKRFCFNELKKATGNFRQRSMVGEGGFGSVFKGWIDPHSLAATKPGSGIAIAVKRHNQDGFQGHNEWLVSIQLLLNFLLDHWFG